MSKIYKELLNEFKRENETFNKNGFFGRLSYTFHEVIKSFVPNIGSFQYLKNYIYECPTKAIISGLLIGGTISAGFTPLYGLLNAFFIVLSFNVAIFSIPINHCLEATCRFINKTNYAQNLTTQEQEIHDKVAKTNFLKTAISAKDSSYGIALNLIACPIFLISVFIPAALPLSFFNLFSAYVIANSTLKDAKDLGNNKVEDHPTYLNQSFGKFEELVSNTLSGPAVHSI